MEAKLQRKIIKWLKDNKFYVIKTRPQPGIPVGCPDIIALKDAHWVAIEVKASADAPFRPGQTATLDYLKTGNTYVFAAHPDNWEDIRIYIETNFL